MLLETVRRSARFILFEKLNDREKKKREGEAWRIVFALGNQSRSLGESKNN